MDPATQRSFGQMVHAAIRAAQLTPPQAAVILCDVVAQLAVEYSEDPDKTVDMLTQRIHETAKFASQARNSSQEGPSTDSKNKGLGSD